MLEKNEVVKVKIDSLIYGGEGVGKVDNFAIFVENSAPGDVLNVKITKVKRNFARGEIVEILEPSPTRVEPKCKIIKDCGGCNWQHIDYSEQLKAKKQVIEYNIQKIGGMDIPVKDVIPSENIYHYRCKIQYHFQKYKSSDSIKLGYYKKGTYSVVNTDCCPIQPEIIDSIAKHIREKAESLKLSVYDTKTRKGLLKHLVLLYSQAQNNLFIIFVVNSNEISNELKELAASCNKEFPQVIGTLVNFNTKHKNFVMGNKTILLEGQDYIEEQLEDKIYRVTAGSFFQINPSSAINMFNIVKDMIKDKLKDPNILDVYAGVASFAIWLKDIASTITAIEEYPQAVKDARTNIALNKDISGAEIKMIKGGADKVLEKLAEEKKSYEVVILDPPRKGCSLTAIQSAAKLAEEYIIYVSCNPATLVRDLRLLKDLGFTTEYIQPVDMFCHTYHVESIALIKRDKVQ